ncbi:P-loop containing nucleoside triphosphate hydrolase protein [Pilaira anomala]|nr:P-loop containing nucleoside triphosphate hydrolase protein [Pilaira anomala]
MLCLRSIRLNNKRCYSTFEKLGISPFTCQKLESKFNVTRPTHAQEQFIPSLVQGRQDLLLRDRTGTGKTFGTALTLASAIPQSTCSSVHALYIVPNQELAFQIGTWIQQLTKHEQNLKVIASQDQRQRSSAVIPHTVVGTPARILESIQQGNLPVHALERLVLDEADQALSLPKRFATVRQQQKRAAHPKPAELLLELLSKYRHQTMISSATLNRPLRYFLKQKGWIHDPLFIDLVQGSQLDDERNATVQHHCLIVSDDTIRNIEQEKENVSSHDKRVEFDDLDDRMMESIAVLKELEPVENGILFISPITSVASVKDKLKEHGVVAEDIKEYDPNAKDNKLWIATEFTARGVDIPGVSHVFILGKPVSITSYVHMAGRTGRLSPKGFVNGKVISLVREHGWSESKMLNMYDLLNIPVKNYQHVI